MLCQKNEVAVLMPVWNQKPEVLSQAISAILAQTFTDFQFIIVSNGSNEETMKIIGGFAIADSRIKVFYLPEACLRKALNFGLEKVNSEFLAIQDSDDISLPYRIEKQVKFLKERPGVSFCGSYFQCFTEDGKDLEVLTTGGLKCLMEHGTICKPCSDSLTIKRIIGQQNCFAHSSIMFRTEVVKKFKYSESKKHFVIEDWIMLRDLILKHGATASNMEEILVLYRINKTGLSFNPLSRPQELENIRIELSGENERICNKVLDISDLENDLAYFYSKLKELKVELEKKGVPFNIDGMDNKPYTFKPRFWEYAMAYSNIKKGGRVLDAGTGYSLFPLFLADMGLEVSTVDLGHQSQIEGVIKKSGRKVKHYQGDFKSLPFQSEYFDSVCCISCLEHLPLMEDVHKSLKEFCRILKKGGTLFLTIDYHKDFYDFNTGEWTNAKWARYFNWQTFNEKVLDVHPEFYVVGNDEFVDNTDWENPPLYGKYTFASIVLRKK
jgi:glycosyltransferase involved in cell wall biosynthesis